MSITLANRISGAGIGARFARIGRQAKRKRPEYTQEICGPTLTVGVVGLFLLLAILIPA